MSPSMEEPPRQGGHSQTGALLSSRFRPRRVRGTQVDRARLTERLDEASTQQLTLVIAPAGFGKSKLLAQWASVAALPVSWVSLTAAENDPQLMAAYLVAAIRSLGQPATGSGDASIGGTADPHQVMTELLGELAEMTSPIVLVLDDYHVIEADAAHDIVQMLIDDAPETVRLIVSCRTLPSRVQACLADVATVPRIDANDLRFTLDEIASFLALSGHELPDDDVLVLNSRINGWIAGAQMFAITLGDSEASAADVLSGFDSTNQLLHDFLLQEVFEKQTPELQAFLLRSALFKRVSADLCRGAMEHGQPVEELLEQVVQGQLFLAPAAGDGGTWLAYEPLFHDFLRQLADVVLGERERTVLLRRAAYWCEREGLTDDAIEYALGGEDWPHAATMILPTIMAMFGSDEITRTLAWLQVLPEHLFESDAELATVAAWAYIRAGSLADVPRLLTMAQRMYEDTADRLGLANVSCAFAELGRYRADGNMTLRYARLARELLASDNGPSMAPSPLKRLPTLDPEQSWRRNDALSRLQTGTGLARQGKVNEAADELLAAHAYAVAHNRPEYEAATMLQLGQVRMLQGRLDDALACYEAVSTSPDWYIVSRRIALTGLADVRRERRQFEEAQHYLDECRQIIDTSPLGFGTWNMLVSQARLDWSRRATSRAHENAEIAMRRTIASGLAWQAGIAEALAVRIRLSSGDFGPALSWAHDRRLAPDDPPDFLRLHEHLVYARLLIAQGAPEDAIELLAGSLSLAEEDGRIDNAIEISVLLGLACLESGDRDRAARAIRRALRYGERGGYLQVFVDEGLSMTPLLALVEDGEVTPAYYRQILDILSEPELPPTIVDGEVSQDAISTRELDVLRLIARGFTNHEIADTLGLSGYTVKHRIESVHGKLGVWTHAEALHKARALGLLAMDDD